MKKVLSIIAMTAVIAVVMSACKGRTATAPVTTVQDTTGFAEFKAWQAWKLESEVPAPVVQQRVIAKSSPVRSGSMNSSTTNEAKTAKKRGMSKAAKGAVIGGVTGGVLGAVIHKRNRVAGGVVGAVLGGGVGYGIGRSKDKKDGRY